MAVHHAKAGKAEVARQRLVQPGLAEVEVVGGVEDLARLAVCDLVQPDRRLEEAPEMEELHRERTAAVLPQRPIRPEPDLLIGVVVDRLQDVRMADHRLLIRLLRERFGLSLQPVEVERLGRPEVDLCRPGGGAHEAAVQQGGKRADARGEQRLAAIELHGSPEIVESVGRTNSSPGRASGRARSSGGAHDIYKPRQHAKVRSCRGMGGASCHRAADDQRWPAQRPRKPGASKGRRSAGTRSPCAPAHRATEPALRWRPGAP
jgi:hypothetical protein